MLTLASGAAAGIGIASAKAFARSGVMVALADINEDGVLSATDEMLLQGIRRWHSIAMSRTRRT